MKQLVKNVFRTIRLYRLNQRVGISDHVPQDILPFPQPGKSVVKLNIGGGKKHPHLDGWTIVDLREETSDITMDITAEKLPFNDDSVDIIFTSHTLEHIYPQHLTFVLSEFHRVLKPSTGLLRISVPDIEKAVQAYVSKDLTFFSQSSIGRFEKDTPLGGLLASWFYSTRVFKDPDLKHGDGHVHCFDKDYLSWWLTRAGFTKIWKSEYRGSVIDELRSEGFDLHKNGSLFIEALK